MNIAPVNINSSEERLRIRKRVCVCMDVSKLLMTPDLTIIVQVHVSKNCPEMYKNMK